MASFMSFTFTMSSLFSASAAQINCDSQAISRDINVTDQLTIVNPFQPPVGPYSANVSRNWTWQLSTQSPFHLSDGDTSIQQSLSLSIIPPPSPGLFEQDSYVGCGVIIHGAWQKKVVANQNDLRVTAQTLSVTSAASGSSRKLAEFNAKYMRWKKKDGKDGKRPSLDSKNDNSACEGLTVSKFNGTVQDWKNDFAPGAWGEPFTWASYSLKDSKCTADTPSFGVHTWGASTYNSTSLRSYNNLTTIIEPIITTLHITEQESVSWAKAHMMCLRSGKHMSKGSSKPSEVHKDILSTGARQGVPTALLTYALDGLLVGNIL